MCEGAETAEAGVFPGAETTEPGSSLSDAFFEKKEALLEKFGELSSLSSSLTDTLSQWSSQWSSLGAKDEEGSPRRRLSSGGSKEASSEKDVQEMAREVSEPTQPAAVPSLLGQDRRHLQGVMFCLGLGLYTSHGHDLSVDGMSWAKDMGSQMDLAQFKMWLNSRLGVYVLPEEYEAAMPAPPGWMTVALIAIVLWAQYEANAFPRHQSMQTAWDCARMLMQFLGDLAMAPFFFLLPGELTEVYYAPTAKNQRILSSCNTMWRFKQMPIFRNAFLSFAALMYYDFTGHSESMVHREKLETPDGGLVALDWWGSSAPGANGKSKVLFISSTWTGDSLVYFMRMVCKHFSAHGWQCVIMVKRGCGLNIPNTQTPGAQAAPWCLSGFDDIQLAIDHVAKVCPGVPICGMGPSLGAGQLRNYVNRSGTDSKLAAAVIVDSGEDWDVAFDSLDTRLPLISVALKSAADVTLDVCGVPAKFGSEPEEGKPVIDPTSTMSMVRGALTTKCSVRQMIKERMAPAHGYEDSDFGCSQYIRSCQPHDPAGCKIPVLEMFTYNDVLTDVAMIRDLQQLYVASSNIVTCTTRQGTHVIRWGGNRGRCWVSQVGCEFLEAALRERAEKIEAQ